MRVHLQRGGYVEVCKNDDCTLRVLAPSAVNMTAPEALQIARILSFHAEAAETELEQRAGTFRVQIMGTNS
jgi:hypothetical protein